MNRVGILARASTNNEIFQTKILAWVSTLQSSTQHKINQKKVIEKKNRNRKCSNENEIKNEIKVKSKYRH